MIKKGRDRRWSWLKTIWRKPVEQCLFRKKVTRAIRVMPEMLSDKVRLAQREEGKESLQSLKITEMNPLE